MLKLKRQQLCRNHLHFKKQFATIAKSILCKKIHILSEEFWILHLFSIWFGFLFFGNKFWWASISLKIWLECQWFSKSLWIFFSFEYLLILFGSALESNSLNIFSVWKKLFFEERFALRISTLGTKKWFELENGHLLNKTKMKEKIWKI